MSLDVVPTVTETTSILGGIKNRLDTTYSISLKASHILLLIVTLTLAVTYTVRYRLSRTYSRLSKDLDNNVEDDQSIAADMWKELNDSDTDTSTNEKPVTSHFDEFLKAIKVFGYLEHDVFTELTKSTQTLRVQTNEIVKLKDLGGFAVVISGAMKVYCQSSQSDSIERERGIFTLPEPQNQKDALANYDLLNEITVSAPISSLSSILSLFSETIESDSPPTEFDKVNATVLAVASEPSTIVVIPAKAFKDLTRKFPQATANIVQVILFRWSQITVRTCQRYLNLTQEFYGTERMLNQMAQQRIERCFPRNLVESIIKKMKKQSKESGKDVFELRSYNVGKQSKLNTESDDENEVGPRDRSNPSMESKQQNGTRERSKSYGQQSSHLDFELQSSISSDYTSEFDTTFFRQYSLGSTREPSEEPSVQSWLNASKKSSAISSRSASITDNTPQRENSESKSQVPFRDPEEMALRKAIVETMFKTIRVDSVFNLPEDFTESKSEDDASSLSEFAENFEFKQRSARKDSSAGTDDEPKKEKPTHEKRKDPFMVKNKPGRASESLPNNEEYSDDGEKSTSSSNFRYSDVIEDASEVIELVWYKKGQYISKYGDKSRGLVYVMDGLLEVGYCTVQSDKNSYQKLYNVEPGQMTGFLETISSYSSFVDLLAKKDSCVAIISKSYFERLAETYPLLYITAAKALTTSLTRPIVQLDFALEWISIKSGGKLISEGHTANAVYFVLNGRMRVYNKKDVIGDYGQGSTIGELETMSGEKYPGAVVAVRDTELSRFPKTLVECLTRQHPSVTFEITRMVVQAMRLRNLQSSGEANISDFKTLAILRASHYLPVEEFAVKLSKAFAALGKEVTVLTHSAIMQYLGKYTYHKMGSLRLKAYLADLEEKNDILLYVADSESSSQWSRTCIDQADCVLLLADGSAPPVFSDVEKMLVKSPTNSRAHLILLHNEKTVSHGSTAKWLKSRPWINAHYHVKIPFISESIQTQGVAKSTVQKKINQIKLRVKDELRVLQQRKEGSKDEGLIQDISLGYKNDFNRLARVLAGEAVGVVLGGGGARGISHIGVLQALEEAGVPIDLVGGTSIGSFIGGLYAKEYDIVPVMRKSKAFSVKMSSFWRLLADLTYPMTAWTTGHAFNSAVWKCLGDSRIEDFWVRYFTNTTNLTDSKMEVHEKGYAWRFIRASMSLAGLLPPLEENGKMLLDGGYVDNLPVTEMKKKGARYIIAVDVGAVDDTTPIKYGDTLSGFGALVNKFNPFSSRPNVPNIAEIQQRLTYVSSVKALEEAKNAPGVIYLRPPIDNYATLDFSKFDEIREVGFNYGKKEIEEQIAKGALPGMINNAPKSETSVSTPRYRRYSF